MQRSTVVRPSSVLLPHSSLAVDAGLVVLFGALTALTAQISIPLPGTPTPLTGQTFGVLLAGAALGSRRGALSQLAYLAAGLTLPVFSGGGTWATSIAKGTEGFLVGFVLVAFLVGWLAERGWTQTFPKTLAAMTIGHLAIYTVGVLPYATYWGMGLERALMIAFVPFIVSSIVKIVLAAVLFPSAHKFVNSFQKPS